MIEPHQTFTLRNTIVDEHGALMFSIFDRQISSLIVE